MDVRIDVTERVDGAVPPPPSLDALLPPAMAQKAEELGAKKVSLGTFETLLLSVLAGAFIALGAMFATTVTVGELPFGVERLLAGIVFSLGLILVVIAGAELFTGNNLIVMATASGRVPIRRLLRNWGLVYVGNFVGAVATALLVFAGKQYEFADGEVGANVLSIAETKGGLGFGQAIALGILCNALVCLAIWLTYSARSVTDKVLAIVFPISAFVAAGFEHSVANMYFLSSGLLVEGDVGGESAHVNFEDAVIGNLVPVTIGNVIGGAVMVGLVYWLVYLRRR
jgi:formate/nitrite transporter